MRIAKINTILKCPVNKLFAVENTYHDTNQTDKASHKEIASPLPCCPVICEYSWKKNQIKKKANSALQHLKTDFWSMMVEERYNSLLLVCIHQDIFFDYDKIIDVYAFRYPRRMLLIYSLSENWTIETFNARKTYKAYINFCIFSLYFIVVICKIFCFASTY